VIRNHFNEAYLVELLRQNGFENKYSDNNPHRFPDVYEDEAGTLIEIEMRNRVCLYPDSPVGGKCSWPIPLCAAVEILEKCNEEDLSDLWSDQYDRWRA